MLSFYPVVGRELSFSIYSPPKLNPPLNAPLPKAQLNLKVEGKKVLMLVYRDGRLSEIYDQPLLTLNLEEEGSYQLKVYSYKFKAFGFYFGLGLFSTFLLCSPPRRRQRSLWALPPALAPVPTQTLLPL